MHGPPCAWPGSRSLGLHSRRGSRLQLEISSPRGHVQPWLAARGLDLAHVAAFRLWEVGLPGTWTDLRGTHARGEDRLRVGEARGSGVRGCARCASHKSRACALLSQQRHSSLRLAQQAAQRCWRAGQVLCDRGQAVRSNLERRMSCEGRSARSARSARPSPAVALRKHTRGGVSEGRRAVRHV